jgi:hypothetical protein
VSNAGRVVWLHGEESSFFVNKKTIVIGTALVTRLWAKTNKSFCGAFFKKRLLASFPAMAHGLVRRIDRLAR